VRAFADEGARVAIASRSQANLARAVMALEKDGIHAFAVPADLADAASAQAMARAVEKQFGRIDILVNSAGAARRTPPEELAASHWHAAMDAKYFTYIHAIDAVLPAMLKAGGGVIVNVSAAAASRPTPCTSRAGRPMRH
jgi:NAD(P)-dependent dehydrogenase (short-subunit alcohol dehydrogenase family)